MEYINLKLERFKENIKDKKVAVLGLGISNRPLVKYLGEIGVKNITGFDRAEPDSQQAVELKKELGEYISDFSLGDKYTEKFYTEKYDYIFKTPVIRFDIPELLKAKENGAVITSEMEIFMQLCPAEIFAVTGSDGKTTTTTLIYIMLKESGYKTWLGGNIGRPLLGDIDKIKPEDKVVLELSSFQLQTMSVSPHIAVVTNVSPNHLDVHKSYAEYIEAKSNIFSHQKAAEGDFAVLNGENPVTVDFAGKVPGEYRFFSRKKEDGQNVYIKDDIIKYKKTGNSEEISIVDIKDILLPGTHNQENYMAAIGAVIDYVKPEVIEKIAKDFGGVEHRLELVRILDGVKYYNSSIDSSPSRTIAALNTFKDKVILISGGKDKGIPYDEIGPCIMDRVKTLILIGPTAGAIENAVIKEWSKRGDVPGPDIIHCSTYEEIVNKAHEIAKEGDCVLLSPASTSFDMFKNFEERGRLFKELVNRL